MNKSHCKTSLLIAVFIFLSVGRVFSQAPAPAVKTTEALISDACKSAAEKKSLVLLKFSAEWCPWCVDLEKIIQEKNMQTALNSFVLVSLDVGKRIKIGEKKTYEKNFDVMMKYCEKAFIPQLIILDQQGKIVARLNPDDYEKKNPDGNDPEKLSKILASYSKKL